MIDIAIPYTISLRDREIDILELNTFNQLRINKSITFYETPFQKVSAIFKYADININDYNLNYIDCLLIVLYKRIISAGNDIDLNVIYKEKETTYKLNLLETYEVLKSKLKSFTAKSFSDNNVTVVCDLPRAKDQESLFRMIESKCTVDDIVPFFITSLNIDDIRYNVSTFDIKDKEKICSQLSILMYNHIREYILQAVVHFRDIFLYKSSSNDDIYLNILDSVYLYYIEFLYTFDLLNLHEQIYTLCSRGLSYKYIMSLSEQERYLYFNIIKSHIEKQTKDTTADTSAYSTDILSDESLIYRQDDMLMNSLTS